jgi:hypothetical protein
MVNYEIMSIFTLIKNPGHNCVGNYTSCQIQWIRLPNSVDQVGIVLFGEKVFGITISFGATVLALKCTLNVHLKFH